RYRRTRTPRGDSGIDPGRPHYRPTNRRVRREPASPWRCCERSPVSVARFFVENRHISWVLLVGVIAWGIWAYAAMPKRKDPDIPVRQVAVVTPWPGQSAERVEQLVTRKIEERVAQNIRVAEITSTTRAGLSVVYAEVDEEARIDASKEFDDIKVKLDELTDLPEGAGPVQYIKEFGETS